jgi:hypothetical protein
VKLERINIFSEVSMLAAFAAAPCMWNFREMIHVFSFLSVLFLMTAMSQWMMVLIYWSNSIPMQRTYPSKCSRATKPGKPLQMITFVDSNHATNLLTHRS